MEPRLSVCTAWGGPRGDLKVQEGRLGSRGDIFNRGAGKSNFIIEKGSLVSTWRADC